jgi:predicted amidohydrolase
MRKILLFVILNISVVTFGQNVNLTKYDNSEQTITRVRIASAAILPDKWEKEKNWERIENAVREAAVQGGAHVVVTPEGVLEGYVINQVNRVKDEEEKKKIVEKFLALGEPINGPYIKKASNLCIELDIYLVLGFLEREKKKLLNTAILIDPEGDIVGKYSKTHFAQGYAINPGCYVTGEEYPVFNTPFGKIGMIICYDRQLPEPTRIIALKGAQVLFVPSYGSYTDEDGWNTVLMRARAYENRLPLVFCNPYQSLLIDRGGDLDAIGNAGDIVYFEVGTSPNGYKGRFRNRRPNTYEYLTK